MPGSGLSAFAAVRERNPPGPHHVFLGRHARFRVLASLRLSSGACLPSGLASSLLPSIVTVGLRAGLTENKPGSHVASAPVPTAIRWWLVSSRQLTVGTPQNSHANIGPLERGLLN